MRTRNSAQHIKHPRKGKENANARQRKQKRKKYQSVDHFMRDIDTMFDNAKSYNQDESQIYKEAVFLQVT